VLARAERLDDDRLVTTPAAARGALPERDHIDRNVYLQYERARVQNRATWR
jgi:hypothetical protein